LVLFPLLANSAKSAIAPFLRPEKAHNMKYFLKQAQQFITCNPGKVYRSAPFVSKGIYGTRMTITEKTPWVLKFSKQDLRNILCLALNPIFRIFSP